MAHYLYHFQSSHHYSSDYWAYLGDYASISKAEQAICDQYDEEVSGPVESFTLVKVVGQYSVEKLPPRIALTKRMIGNLSDLRI